MTQEEMDALDEQISEAKAAYEAATVEFGPQTPEALALGELYLVLEMTKNPGFQGV